MRGILRFAHLRSNRETLVADIRGTDVILIGQELWKAWAFVHADVAAARADYAPMGVVGEVTIYRRKLGLRLLTSDDPP
jgi:hypothetical protein